MPPRKRAAAAPTTDPTLTPETDPSTPPGPSQADASGPRQGSDGDDAPPDANKQPTKSDPQKVAQPCGECFPDGWGDGFFARGCEHGTWVRDDLD